MQNSRGQITGLVSLAPRNEALWLTACLVYAAYRATVHIIDHAKKGALGRLLMESVTSTEPGETLEEKLAALTFLHSDDCESRDPECIHLTDNNSQCRRQVQRRRRGGTPQVIHLLRYFETQR